MSIRVSHSLSIDPTPNVMVHPLFYDLDIHMGIAARRRRAGFRLFLRCAHVAPANECGMWNTRHGSTSFWSDVSHGEQGRHYGIRSFTIFSFRIKLSTHESASFDFPRVVSLWIAHDGIPNGTCFATSQTLTTLTNAERVSITTNTNKQATWQ
jgi:hypothetical protein